MLPNKVEAVLPPPPAPAADDDENIVANKAEFSPGSNAALLLLLLLLLPPPTTLPPPLLLFVFPLSLIKADMHVIASETVIPPPLLFAPPVTNHAPSSPSKNTEVTLALLATVAELVCSGFGVGEEEEDELVEKGGGGDMACFSKKRIVAFAALRPINSPSDL